MASRWRRIASTTILPASWGAADQGLRLRTNASAEEPTSVNHVVTFKGPRQAGIYKTREELEFAVSDVDAAASLFTRLGFPQSLSFEKRRESWRLGGCKVELDTLPADLGTFVEVEGENEASVRAVLQQLHLAEAQPLSEGYASMIMTYLKKTANASSTLTFH